MSISLHHALVPQWIQMIGGLEKVLTKAEAHLAEEGMTEAELADCRLAPDMLDFAYQVQSVHSHSLGAVEAVREGVFTPPKPTGPRNLGAMRAVLAQTHAGLDALDPAELDGFIGKPMEFRFREFVMPFDTEEFLLSFSQPNFYFHVTTVYAILRNMGVPIGKFDYVGTLRKKP